MLTSILTRGLSWLFPERCVGCGTRDNPLCDRCVALIPPPRNLETPELLAALPYNHPWIKKLIWRLKYYRGKHLATRLAEILGEKLLEELADINSFSAGTDRWLLVPVPASKTRGLMRGYNQAELLAKALAKKYPDFLAYNAGMVIKTRDTVPQAKILNRQERLENLIGVFAVVAPEPVTGRRIIIVDDVITTGATITEIKRVLKKAKARVVLGIALAHG